MTDDQKTILLKLLKEDQHQEAYDWPTGRPTCTCGYTCKTEGGLDQHIASHTRSFTTPQDLMDCKEALVKEGLWDSFSLYALGKWWNEDDGLSDYPFPDPKEVRKDFMPWLFRTTDEKGEAHFCGLVAEFVEAQQN